MGMWGQRLSIFWRVLLVFILMVFPMYIFSVYVTIKGQNSVRDELLKAAESKGEFYISSLESQLNNVMRLQLNVLNNADIRMLERPDVHISLAEQTKMLNGIRDMLRNTAGMNTYIKEITVFLPLIGKKVTTQTVMSLDFDEYENYLKNAVVENLPFCNIKGHYYINMTPEFYSQSIPHQIDNTPLLVSTQISEEAVRSSINDIAGIKGGGALLISDGRGLDISADGADDFKSKARDILLTLSFNEKSFQKLNVEGTNYQIFYSPSSFLHSALVIYVPENGFMQMLKSFSWWVWSVSALTVLLVIVFSFWIRGMIARPLEKLIAALKQVEDGTADVHVVYARDDEFGHLYKQFNHLVDRLKELVADAYKKELMLKDAEFKQLQYQINPHFLYNSLLVTKALIELGYTDGALKLTKHLSSYYQYITKGMPGDVLLEQEVDHVRDYIEVQNIRFQGRIACEIQGLGDDIKNIQVPRLILQPIVENAYKHGLKNKLKDGLLRISFDKNESYISIIVEDNGDELTDQTIEKLRYELSQPKSTSGSGTGMRNVHDRLRMRFDQDAGITVDRSDLGGLMVKLIICIKR